MSLLEHRPDLLTVQEAAEILRTEPATVESYMNSGEIKHAEIAGKALIPRRFLEKFVANSCKTCYNESVEIHTPAPDGQAAQHLDNRKDLDCMPFQGESVEMAKITRPCLKNKSCTKGAAYIN